MSSVFEIQQVGAALLALAADQSQWSQSTFGKDTERGPIGALKHLEKEAVEAQQAVAEFNGLIAFGLTGTAADQELAVREEMADCLLLILDAARRGGITPLELIRVAQAKMVTNKARVWPKTTGDVPTEHVRA